MGTVVYEFGIVGSGGPKSVVNALVADPSSRLLLVMVVNKASSYLVALDLDGATDMTDNLSRLRPIPITIHCDKWCYVDEHHPLRYLMCLSPAVARSDRAHTPGVLNFFGCSSEIGLIRLSGQRTSRQIDLTLERVPHTTQARVFFSGMSYCDRTKQLYAVDGSVRCITVHEPVPVSATTSPAPAQIISIAAMRYPSGTDADLSVDSIFATGEIVMLYRGSSSGGGGSDSGSNSSDLSGLRTLPALLPVPVPVPTV